MTLKQIEEVVLQLCDFDKYSKLSIDANKVDDFLTLHTCVNLAREEIKLHTNIPALMQIGVTIPAVAGVSGYSLPSDFDIPIGIYFWSGGSNDAVKLKQSYIETLPTTVPVTIGTATPATGPTYGYIIGGTSADLIQIYVFDTPDTNGIILPIYKPVLTVLSLATAEDVIMRKYPKAMIDFTTAFAFQALKKDQANYDKYYTYGMNHCKGINLREVSADTNVKQTVEDFLATKRQDRQTK